VLNTHTHTFIVDVETSVWMLALSDGKASVNPISGCHVTFSAESNKVKFLSPAERVSTCGNQGNDSRDCSRAPCVQEVV
jgi:hypothetical protein